jgi:hypothetical protein
MKNTNTDNNERKFVDLLVSLEERIKREPFTPESEETLLALTKEAKKHAHAKDWAQANLAVRTIQMRWPKLNRRAL